MPKPLILGVMPPLVPLSLILASYPHIQTWRQGIFNGKGAMSRPYATSLVLQLIMNKAYHATNRNVTTSLAISDATLYVLAHASEIPVLCPAVCKPTEPS